MKFLYGYRTADNETREGTLRASSRDAVYAELKRMGVRPFRVELAPGLLNRLQSLGKRTLAIVLLAVVCVALAAALGRGRRSAPQGDGPLPRHQIYGDPVLLAELARTGFATVFDDPGERVLAAFARPGVFVGPYVALADRHSRAARRRSPERRADVAALAAISSRAVTVAASDGREVAELKRIVSGMKAELSRYLANGVGTAQTYLDRLEERQLQEARIRQRVAEELGKTTDAAVWAERNDELRAIGLRPVSLPQEDLD